MATDEQRQRGKDILSRRERGETYTDIAKSYGLTPVRIRQLAIRALRRDAREHEAEPEYGRLKPMNGYSPPKLP